MKNKYAKIAIKALLTVLISFLAHCYYVFIGLALPEWQTWLGILFYNSFSMCVIYVGVGVFSCVMLQSIYSKKWEWLKYAPIYVAMLTLTSFPNGTMRSFITVVVNELFSELFSPEIIFFVV